VITYTVLILASDCQSPGTVVVSGSMEPMIYRGDILFLVGPGNVEAGDVLAFQPKGRRDPIPIFHRVVEIHETKNGRLYLTKGDNNRVDDYMGSIYGGRQRFLTEDELIGKPIGYFPQMGFLTILFAESRIFKIVLLTYYLLQLRNME